MIWIGIILLIGIGVGCFLFRVFRRTKDKLYTFNLRKIEEARRKVIGIRRSLIKQRKIVEKILRKE